MPLFNIIARSAQLAMHPLICKTFKIYRLNQKEWRFNWNYQRIFDINSIDPTCRTISWNEEYTLHMVLFENSCIKTRLINHVRNRIHTTCHTDCKLFIVFVENIIGMSCTFNVVYLVFHIIFFQIKVIQIILLRSWEYIALSLVNMYSQYNMYL